MNQDTGENPRIDGVELGAAVDAVVAAADGRDPEAVRTTLATVTEDGVVSRAGVESALSHAAKVVATPETRVELAAMAFADARETADPVADLAVVQARLDDYASQVAALEARVAALGETLQGLVERREDTDARYEVAAGIRELTEAANALQRDADDLSLEVEGFEKWVRTAAVRYRELGEDVEALAGALDGLAAICDELSAAETGGIDWADATLRVRVLTLLLADLRWELAALREWSAREGRDDGERVAEIEARLDALETKRATIEDRLASLAEPAWESRHGDRLAAFEERLDGVEPPVAWGEVQAALERELAALADSA
jgi:chromosome segregation ATPase